MKHQITRKQPNSHFCFACGLQNQFGLKARFFETANGELVGVFRPAPEHQGYPGRLHGGLISTILDEVMGRTIMIGAAEELWGVTADLNVKFRQPIPLDAEIKVIGRITANKNRYFEASGEIVLADGSVAASATGRFFKMSLAGIADIDTAALHWQLVPEAGDPQAIEL